MFCKKLNSEVQSRNLDPTLDMDPYRYTYSEQQCCESGMFILDPDFYPSRIPDPKTATKERDEKKILSNIFLLPHISQNLKLFYFLTA